MPGKKLRIGLFKSGLVTLDIFCFRDKRLDGFKLIGSDLPPIDSVKYFSPKIRLGFKSCDIQSGFVRIVFDPENIVDFQIKIPAYSFAHTFGAGYFEDAFTCMGRYNDIRPDVLHIRLVE